VIESGQYERTKAGRTGKLPDWYENEPTKWPGDDIYLCAFWELSTERTYGQYLGPIPWSKIIFYGDRLGLDETMVVVFTRILRELDEVFLSDQRGTGRQTEQTKPPGK